MVYQPDEKRREVKHLLWLAIVTVGFVLFVAYISPDTKRSLDTIAAWDAAISAKPDQNTR
jgi:hypothetical protein